MYLIIYLTLYSILENCKDNFESGFVFSMLQFWFSCVNLLIFWFFYNCHLVWFFESLVCGAEWLCVVAAEMRGVRRNDLLLFTVPSLVLLNAWLPYCVRAVVVNGMHYLQEFCFVHCDLFLQLVCFSGVYHQSLSASCTVNFTFALVSC